MEYGDVSHCGDLDAYEMVPCSPFRSTQIGSKSPLHLIDPKMRERESRWYADRFYQVKATPYVDFFFLDTSDTIFLRSE